MAVMLAILDERVKWRNVILLLPENPSEDRCVCCFRAQIGRERTSTQSNWTLQESIQAGHQQKCTDGRPYWKCHKLDFLYRRHSLIRMLEWVSVKGKCWPSYKRALYYNEKRKKKVTSFFVLVCSYVTFFGVTFNYSFGNVKDVVMLKAKARYSQLCIGNAVFLNFGLII